MPLEILAMVPLLLVALYMFVLYDRLLRAEYHQYRDAWDTDGHPAGFFWRAPECKFFTSDSARARVTLKWLFRTPAWIAASPVFSTQLRRLRLLVLLWHIGALAWFVFFLRFT